MGVVPGRVWGSTAHEHGAIREKNTSAIGKRSEPSVSVSLFLEVNNLVIEHERACVGSLHGTLGR